jgi:hypothetical protein
VDLVEGDNALPIKMPADEYFSVRVLEPGNSAADRRVGPSRASCLRRFR